MTDKHSKSLGERAQSAVPATVTLSGCGAMSATERRDPATYHQGMADPILTAAEVRVISARIASGQWDELDLLALCDSHEALRQSVAPCE